MATPTVPYDQAVAQLKHDNPNPAEFAAAKASLDHAYGVNNLSGTGTPGPAPAPSLPITPPAPAGLPSGTGKPSPILEFANTLQQAVQLARQNRNKATGDIMAPLQGTVAASDFNGIIGNMNTASDKTSDALIKKATDLSSPDIITATSDNGDVHGIDKTTGKVVWTAPGVGNKQNGPGSSADILVKSGALTYTRSDYSDDASTLEQSRGTDGWVDPGIYQKLYDAWVSNGGKIADFVKTYPPVQYINPDNDWLPPYLRPKVTGASNPFAS